MRNALVALRHPGSIFYGWRMLGLICIMQALNNGFFSKGAALFLVPVEASLGINRATSALIFSLARSEGAVSGPFTGYLVDRFGAQKFLIIGTATAGVGFLIFASSQSLWTFAMAYLVFISFGATMAFQQANSATVNQWFSRFRVRAISVTEASGNLGSTLLVPIIGLIIVLHSWHMAAVLAGITYLGIILPMAFFIKESPESVGLLPDGATPQQVAEVRKAASESRSSSARRLLSYYDRVDFTVKEALHTSGYWCLLLGTMFRQVAKSAIQVHFVAILIWKGLDPTLAGLVFAFSLGMNVPAKLFFGFVGDRLSKQVVLGGGMMMYVVSLVMLWKGESLWVLMMSSVIGGLSEGITPVNWGAIGDYYGRQYYATLRGIINLSNSWSLVLVPFAAGWWYDHHGNYVMTLVVSMVASLISAVLYVLMRQPKPPVRKPATSPIGPTFIRPVSGTSAT
jgi:MFS family permease